MVTTNCRRNLTLPNTLHHDALLPPMAQNSPISMRYSVSGTTKVGGESQSHHSTELNQENRKMEEKTVHWTMLLLLLTTVCSALFSVVSLQFYFSNTDRFMRSAKSANSQRGIPDVIRDVIASFDVAIVVLSVISFFVSGLQLLFVIKIVKSNVDGFERALQYIRSTSFLRIVALSFWFASILIFAIVLLLTCSIDPFRSLASKCVSVTLGAAALLLATIFAVKTLYFWAKLTYGHVYRGDDCYNYLSTLV